MTKTLTKSKGVRVLLKEFIYIAFYERDRRIVVVVVEREKKNSR